MEYFLENGVSTFTQAEDLSSSSFMVDTEVKCLQTLKSPLQVSDHRPIIRVISTSTTAVLKTDVYLLSEQ